MRDVRNMIVGAVLVFAAYYLGLVVVNVSALPIPGPLMGLFFLLAMLFLFPQLEVHTSRFVTFPLKHMSLLFIPAVLGVSIYWADIQSNALAIAIANIVTTSISLGITAWFSQQLFNGKSGSGSDVASKGGKQE